MSIYDDKLTYELFDKSLEEYTDETCREEENAAFKQIQQVFDMPENTFLSASNVWGSDGFNLADKVSDYGSVMEYQGFKLGFRCALELMRENGIRLGEEVEEV